MDFFSERCLHSDGDVIEKRCCNICLQNEVERLKAELAEERMHCLCHTEGGG